MSSIYLIRFDSIKNHHNGFFNINSIANKCDLYIDNEGLFGNKINPKYIFVRSNYIKNAYDYLMNIKNNYTLICGSDDNNIFHYLNEEENNKLIYNKFCKKIFIENKSFYNEKIFSLPTGMYTDIDAINYLLEHHKNSILPNQKKFKIYCQFNITHSSRNKAKEFSINSELCDYFSSNIITPNNNHDRYKTLEIMESYSFTLCPRGFGIDTHRLWEALCLKTIPIVESSSIDDMHLMLPIIIVNKWEDINEEFLKKELDRLNLKYEGFMNCITLDFWWNYISKPHIFVSGSCRILQPFSYYYSSNTIHGMIKNHYGLNHITMCHDINQHLQFIKYLFNNIELNFNNLKYIFDTFAYKYDKELQIKESHVRYELNPEKNIEFLKKSIFKTDIFIFEICSIKYFIYENYFVRNERCNMCSEYKNSKLELLNLLTELLNIITINKKIIFTSHFRPNIYLDNTNINNNIEERNLIHETLTEFCNNNINCIYYDSSEFIKEYNIKNNKLIVHDDNWHYKDEYLELVYNDIINKTFN